MTRHAALTYARDVDDTAKRRIAEWSVQYG